MVVPGEHLMNTSPVQDGQYAPPGFQRDIEVLVGLVRFFQKQWNMLENHRHRAGCASFGKFLFQPRFLSLRFLRYLGRSLQKAGIEHDSVNGPCLERVKIGTIVFPVRGQQSGRGFVSHIVVAGHAVKRDTLVQLGVDTPVFGDLSGLAGLIGQITSDHQERRSQAVGVGNHKFPVSGFLVEIVIIGVHAKLRIGGLHKEKRIGGECVEREAGQKNKAENHKRVLQSNTIAPRDRVDSVKVRPVLRNHMKLDRRKFLTTSALTGTAAFASPQAPAPARPAPPPEATKILAHFIVNGKPGDIPPAVRKEAARTLLNWVGCTIGGSQDEAVTNGLAALTPFFGPAQASLLGRKERPDIFHAALFNGIASHVLDFDDTHLRTIIHPAGPVCSAILALAEYQPVSGSDFVAALAYGIETECRIGNSVYPAHYDTGWHITGTTGVFGAAAAAGRLLHLNEQQMRWALGLAAVQPVGLREMFGSMTKSFHPGRAAQNGLTAALLAARGFNSSEQGLEAKSGWANVVSTQRNYAEITERLGQSWELSLNTYKPFACGIVIHPTIDACIQLRNQHNLKAADIDKVELRVHPLVLELTGKKTPQAGLEGKFSVYHAAAAALVEGACGVRQFSDRAVKDPVIVLVRDRVSTTIDPAIKEDQVRVAITLKDGRRLEKYIDQAVGSVKNPMSDKDLESKFSGLAEGILPADQVRKVMDLCWKVEALPAVSVLAQAARA